MKNKPSVAKDFRLKSCKNGFKLNNHNNLKNSDKIEKLIKSEEIHLDSTADPKINDSLCVNNNNKYVMDMNKFEKILNHKDHQELNITRSFITHKIKKSSKFSDQINLKQNDNLNDKTNNNISSYLNYKVIGRVKNDEGSSIDSIL